MTSELEWKLIPCSYRENRKYGFHAACQLLLLGFTILTCLSPLSFTLQNYNVPWQMYYTAILICTAIVLLSWISQQLLAGDWSNFQSRRHINDLPTIFSASDWHSHLPWATATVPFAFQTLWGDQIAFSSSFLHWLDLCWESPSGTTNLALSLSKLSVTCNDNCNSRCASRILAQQWHQEVVARLSVYGGIVERSARFCSHILAGNGTWTLTENYAYSFSTAGQTLADITEYIPTSVPTNAQWRVAIKVLFNAVHWRSIHGLIWGKGPMFVVTKAATRPLLM